VSAPGVLGNDTDPERNPLTAVVGTEPAHGTVALNPNGSFTYSPALNFAGTDIFTYTARDATTASAPATVTITVTPVNDAPVLDPIPAQNVRWGNLLGFTAHAGDVDVPADSLIYSLVNAPAGVSVNPTTGAVSFTPTSAQVGVVTFKVRVTDSGSPNLFAEAPVTVAVDKRPTRLVYSGDSAAQFSDPAAVRATLTDDGGQGLQGQVVASRTVTFGIGAQNAAAVTGPAGLAQTTVTLNQPAGSPGVSSTFAGDGLYLASADADPFTITTENATVAYTGPLGVTVNNPVELSGRVTEAADAHLGNRVDATQLRFTVRRTIDNAVAGSCPAMVNSTGPGSGTGHCPVSLATGTYRVTVELVGNGFYTAPAAQSSPILPLIVVRLP
jgi:VCBS repeat-containing protein